MGEIFVVFKGFPILISYRYYLFPEQNLHLFRMVYGVW